METVEVVIKIPISELECAKKGYTKARADVVYRAIENGTVLPKGHGRLIDADEIQFENADFDTYGDYSRAFDAIDQADTIIEADKEVENGNENENTRRNESIC